MPETFPLEQIIELAEMDLKKFIARKSGFPKNDEHIEKAQNIICGAKKLLEELKTLDNDIGPD